MPNVPPDVEQVTFWDVFLPEQIFFSLVADVSSVLVPDTPDNSEWRITQSPLDGYAAIRNIKSVSLTLSAAQDYSSGNDMLLSDVMHELFDLYISVRAHYLVVTCIAKFSVLRAVSLQFSTACTNIQWAVRQLAPSWSRTIASTRCRGYSPQWTLEVDNNTEAFERMRTYGRDVSMHDLLLLAQFGPTARAAQQAWTVCIQSFQWLGIHQGNLAALSHWRSLLHLSDIQLYLAQLAKWTAITVSVLAQDFKSKPISDNTCVLDTCSTALHGASCPLTGKPKKACMLQHYRQAKRLFIARRLFSKMSRQIAATEHSSFRQQLLLLKAFRMLRVQSTARSLRSRMLRPSPRLAQCLAAAAEDDCWSGSSASKTPCLLIPDNRGELLEAPELDVQEAKTVLTGVCTSCRKEKALSAFDKVTCRSCLSKRRESHAESKEAEYADSWAATEPVPGSRLFLQTVIKGRVLLMVQGVEEQTEPATARAKALLPKLCAYLTDSTTVAPTEINCDGKLCSSCKRLLSPSNFGHGKASCRPCLKRKKTDYQNKKAMQSALLGDGSQTLSAASALSARLSKAFEQVCDIIGGFSSAAATRAVRQLDHQTNEHQTGAPAEHQLVLHNSVHHLLEVDAIKALCGAAASAHVSAVAGSIFAQQSALWLELENSIRSDEHILEIPDLTPTHPEGPATRAILKALTFNASTRACSQVLATAISELSHVGQGVDKLVRVKVAVDSISEAHPVLTGNTTATSVDAADPTCSGSVGIRRRLDDLVGLASIPEESYPCSSPTPKAPTATHANPVVTPKVADAAAAGSEQARAREHFWSLVDQAHATGDFKQASRDPAWRADVCEAHAALYQAANKATDAHPRKIRSAAALILSQFPDRAQMCLNPARVAQVVGPAIDQDLISQQEAQFLVSLTQKGLCVEEFRDFDGPALNLLQGNTEEPEDQQILLDFYFEHASRGRLLILDERFLEECDKSGELVLSPSFLVRAPGKKPRAILNLSSTESGVNQRMFQADTCSDGYCTVVDIARMILFSLILMVLSPQTFSLEQLLSLVLTLIVMDADAAFFRVGVNPETVGIQTARIAGYTIVTLCCAFGWARSAEVFSHITAAIVALHKSEIDSAAFIAEGHSFDLPELSNAKLAQIINNVNPVHSHLAIGHVDDMTGIEVSVGDRPKASAADLAWSVMAMLGHDGLSAKKFIASSFWSQFQKVIGAWFNVRTFTVTMPLDKIQQSLDILNSDDFASHQISFPIGPCATLRGKIRWSSLTTPLGDMPCLINIEKQRRPGEPGTRKIKPIRSSGESEQLALSKFRNDLLVRKVFLEAAAASPRIASCSMASVLPIEDRLKIPGQSKALVWLSGDFSVLGQSWGIEFWDFDTDSYRMLYSYVAHPQEVLDQLYLALEGKAEKNHCVVSTVLERANVLMAEFMFRDILRGRPVIVLDDNQGSVAAQRSGYSRNVLSQAMQLVSNLRQALDESRQTAFYCSTHNMSVYDKISRQDWAFMERANAELAAAGDTTWTYVEPTRVVHQINEWLARSWDSDLPLLAELVHAIKLRSSEVEMPVLSINLEQLREKPDLKWQDRVRAAASPIPHWLGSFGPMAYSTDHMISPTVTGAFSLGWKQLQKINRSAQHSSATYSVFDAFAGGGGATISAISAGLFVAGMAEISKAEVVRLEDLTGQQCFGDVRSLNASNLTQVDVLISCSVCKDFCPLGSLKGEEGAKGGDFYSQQAFLARDSAAAALVCENVNGVEEMGALAALQRNCSKVNFNQFHSERVVFADHSDPENRARRIVVAFEDSVTASATTAFQWPFPTADICVSGHILLSSTHVHDRFWDKRAWNVDLWRWKLRLPHAERSIWSLGYMPGKDKIGSPYYPNRIFHMLGLFPTVLASGNTGLVLVIQLRAMCPKYSAFKSWANITQSALNRPLAVWAKAALRLRRVMPCECMASKGFPLDAPKVSDSAAYRMAGNAVPIPYFTRLLISVTDYIRAAGVTPKPRAGSRNSPRAKKSLRERMNNPSPALAARLAAAHSCDTVSGSLQQKETKIKSGNHLLHDMNRAEVAQVPLVEAELANMAVELDRINHGTLCDDSVKNKDLFVEHWKSFCHRFGLPVLLNTDTLSDIKAAAAQGQLFVLYELANFKQKAANVNLKLWAVDKLHEASNLPAPFAENGLLRKFMKNALAKDNPALPKVPIAQKQLDALKEMLNLEDRPAFAFWVGIRFAIVFFCRISEWERGGKHSVKWKYLSFLDADSKPMIVESLDQLPAIAALEVIFWSDKSHIPGTGLIRTWHAIEDLDDENCVVRDMARLWLLSEKIPEHEVFTWSNGLKGVTRHKVNTLLKKAAEKAGIPAPDTASHSCRVTGLSQMCRYAPFEVAKEWGRWKSDCARRYWWASADMVKAYAAAIWKPSSYTRVRGGGAVQRY